MSKNPYPASDRAKAIVKKSMTMDTLLSVVVTPQGGTDPR
jgi:hypothetical protein